MKPIDPADFATEAVLSTMTKRFIANMERAKQLIDEIDDCLAKLIEVYRGAQVRR